VTDGEVSALSLLLNLFYPFETGHRLTPYIMGGLGAAALDVDNVTVNGTRFIDDSEIVFAYQVGTGIELAINRNLSLDLAYRYFGTADKEFENDTLDAATKHFDFRYETHNAMLGLRYKF
jgi:opacity protein-like surface antigen